MKENEKFKKLDEMNSNCHNHKSTLSRAETD